MKSKSYAKRLINLDKGVFLYPAEKSIYVNFKAGVPLEELKNNANKVKEALNGEYLVKDMDVLHDKAISKYRINDSNSDTQLGNTRTILGMNPAYTVCSSVVQVWRNWVITVNGKQKWCSTDYDGDKTISVTLNGVKYNLPAYRVLAIGGMVNASELDKDTYDYLCELIYGDEHSRSPFAVHHIDGNHHNNKASNLAILHRRDHDEAHRLLDQIIPATFSDPYRVEFVKRQYLEFISIHSSYNYIVNNY